MPRHALSSISTAGGIPAPVIQDPSQNPISVYYIHPGENSTTPLVNLLLTSKNYHAWARLMRKALLNKNKICFIDGTLPKPDRFDPSFEAWEKCNNFVHTWIMNSVSPNIAHSILYIESACTTWNKLKHRFAQADSVRIADLQLEICLLKQELHSATDFFTQLTVLWEELENLSPIPLCTCPVKCTCDLSKYIAQSKERDFIMRFLTGLNEGFASCKSQILMTDPMPTIDRVFSMVIQFERQNHLLPENDEEQVMINVVDGRRPSGRGRGYSNKICTYCGMSDHTVETCYKKNGYPPGFKFRDGTSPAAHCIAAESDDSKSVKDQGSSPFTQEEYRLLRTLLQSNTAKPTAEPSTAAASSSQACSIIRNSPPEGIPLATFHAACYSAQSNCDEWIIDSGASDHICSSVKWFCTQENSSYFSSIAQWHIGFCRACWRYTFE